MHNVAIGFLRALIIIGLFVGMMGAMTSYMRSIVTVMQASLPLTITQVCPNCALNSCNRMVQYLVLADLNNAGIDCDDEFGELVADVIYYNHKGE